MRPLPFLAVVALLLGLPSGVRAAAAAALPPELESLRHSLARTQKLTARFKETRHWAALEDVLVSEGTLQYEREGKLVWRTDAPSESELVMGGKTATLRYPKLGTSEVIDFASDPGMGKVFESIRAVLQADLERLEPLFVFKVEHARPLHLTLQPRTPELGKILQSIRLEFDAQQRLQHLVLKESGGDSTDIVFRDQVVKTSGR